MKSKSIILKALCLWSAFFTSGLCKAQTDTIRLMTYNVLYYGETPSCQGPHDLLHGYFKTIIQYTQPDILCLAKLAAPVQEGNPFAKAPQGWADSIIKYAMNAAFPDRYAYCPFTNAAKANNIELLIYNKNKLGYAGIVHSYVNITDFNLYKLYYKDPNLSTTHDTTFLYVIPNHDKSGDESVAVRDGQIKGELAMIKKHFSSLPNFINMGDFNVRNSDEPFYQNLCFPTDSAFRFFDPPFFEGTLKYPANWDHDPIYTKYFTTSTRISKVAPNPCGSAGGGKNWYDHIFLSSWIMHNTNYVKYIPNSYRTIGNDGLHFGQSINTNTPVNNSAPPEVIEALYQFSNKYPVMADLLVTANTTGKSPKDPEFANNEVTTHETIAITEPVEDKLIANFSEGLLGQDMTMTCTDASGKVVKEKSFIVKKQTMDFPLSKLPAGTYNVRFGTVHSVAANIQFSKK